MKRVVFILLISVLAFTGQAAAQQVPAGAAVCEVRKEADGRTHTYWCAAGKTCCMAARKCCDAGATCTAQGCILQMSCNVCYNNQKRDSDACTRSGNLMQQSDCVNRVNGELKKCLSSCR
jgi:hypothetical protein